jgi:NADPH:quinone reductase
MKAALCKSLDGPDGIVIADLPDPTPGPGEVVVRVRAAALNFLDTLITRGKYQVKPDLPFSPAGEYAGEILKVGADVTGFKAGDRVCGWGGYGGARQHLVARADAIIPVPASVTDTVAAAFIVTYGTAIHGLKDRGQVKAGETVAVLGASGGAGLAAVEIAKLLGATVIAVASSDDKLAVCREHGADHTLNYATGDLKQGLRDLTGGRGVDVVYDCVGGPHAEAALRSIAWLGRFLVIGFAAGDIPKIPLNLTLLKSCDIRGVYWGEAVRRDPAGHKRNLTEVLGWIATGKLRPHIHATVPLEQTADAIRMLDARAVSGKVVILP